MSRPGADVIRAMSSPSPPASPDAVDVYWRPGCGFCMRLRRHFDKAGVVVRWHNIWEDDRARRFVRDHNAGNETVPTVAVGDVVVTNPSPPAFVERLRAEHPDLVSADEPEGLFARGRGQAGDGHAGES